MQHHHGFKYLLCSTKIPYACFSTLAWCICVCVFCVSIHKRKKSSSKRLIWTYHIAVPKLYEKNDSQKGYNTQFGLNHKIAPKRFKHFSNSPVKRYVNEIIVNGPRSVQMYTKGPFAIGVCSLTQTDGFNVVLWFHSFAYVKRSKVPQKLTVIVTFVQSIPFPEWQ